VTLPPPKPPFLTPTPPFPPQVFLFFSALGTAWLVSNFSEKIQDSMSTFQRERDIRFAIENQALKDRVAKRWKKAVRGVAGGVFEQWLWF
jgi:hypothetical protein